MTKIEKGICEFCNKVIYKKPLKINIFYHLNSERYSISRKSIKTDEHIFCSTDCRNKHFGNFVDCINPPKDIKDFVDNYPDEEDGLFYCPSCDKRTNKKTYTTCCVVCGTALNRRFV